MMVFNSSLHAGHAYKLFMRADGIVHTFGNKRVIWSSACVLKCTLKWGNMRNPYRVFYLSRETASDNGEEGGDDAKSAWPFDALGCTRGTMAVTMGCQGVSRS